MSILQSNPSVRPSLRSVVPRDTRWISAGHAVHGLLDRRKKRDFLFCGEADIVVYYIYLYLSYNNAVAACSLANECTGRSRGISDRRSYLGLSVIYGDGSIIPPPNLSRPPGLTDIRERAQLDGFF